MLSVLAAIGHCSKTFRYRSAALLSLGILSSAFGENKAPETLPLVSTSMTAPGCAGVDEKQAARVSSADIQLDKAVAKHEHGLPIGNGRMGGLIWARKDRIKLQINRVDVFGFNSSSSTAFTGLPAHDGRTDVPNDYCGGCGFVDINFGETVFPAEGFHQRLSVYDGTWTAEGKDLSVRAIAWPQRDVIAFEIQDRRQVPTLLEINLQMLRPNRVESGRHLAESDFEQGGMILKQRFSEKAEKGTPGRNHYCASVMGIEVIGRKTTSLQVNHFTRRMIVASGTGTYTLLIASDATMTHDQDPMAEVKATLKQVRQVGIPTLIASHIEWWHSFWSKSFIDIPSQPEFMRRWYYYLYLSAASMRGDYPAKFNGQIWGTNGDRRDWGAHYWWWNQCTMHSSFFAANHIELNDPLFHMRSAALPGFELAARQNWGSKGMFIPETTTFDGPEPLNEDIARDLRATNLQGLPPSPLVMAYRERRHEFESRWNFSFAPLPVGWVTHVLAAGARTADLYWRKYQYTQDRAWLGDRAYPFIKGAAEFYRNFPNLKKDADGKYHLHNANLHEHLWGCTDNIDDMSLMRGVFAVAIKASEILDRDRDLRPKWAEVLEHLAPFPNSTMPGAIGLLADPQGRTTWAQGLPPVLKVRGIEGGESPRLSPLEDFDVLTLESTDASLWSQAMATLENHPAYNWFSLKRTPECDSGHYLIRIARAGRADLIERFLPVWPQIWAGGINTPNLLPPREGTEISLQGYGILSETLQQALCQSVAATPEGDPVIRIFPAWPNAWDASFSLLCKGGFLVSASRTADIIAPVTILSQVGGECRIHNPWGDSSVNLRRANGACETCTGALLRFSTCVGEKITLNPATPK